MFFFFQYNCQLFETKTFVVVRFPLLSENTWDNQCKKKRWFWLKVSEVSVSPRPLCSILTWVTRIASRSQFGILVGKLFTMYIHRVKMGKEEEEPETQYPIVIWYLYVCPTLYRLYWPTTSWNFCRLSLLHINWILTQIKKTLSELIGHKQKNLDFQN